MYSVVLCKIILSFFLITNIRAQNLVCKKLIQSGNSFPNSDQCSGQTVIMKGPPGENGASGTAGDPGRNGTDGESGKKGKTGEKGEPGYINETLIEEIFLNFTSKR